MGRTDPGRFDQFIDQSFVARGDDLHLAGRQIPGISGKAKRFGLAINIITESNPLDQTADDYPNRFSWHFEPT